MTTKLEDLRVVIDRVRKNTGHDGMSTRPASVADLLDVLKEEGGDIRWAWELDDDTVGVWVVTVGEVATALNPGRYLVFPIPTEKT